MKVNGYFAALWVYVVVAYLAGAIMIWAGLRRHEGPIVVGDPLLFWWGVGSVSSATTTVLVAVAVGAVLHQLRENAAVTQRVVERLTDRISEARAGSH